MKSRERIKEMLEAIQRDYINGETQTRDEVRLETNADSLCWIRALKWVLK